MIADKEKIYNETQSFWVEPNIHMKIYNTMEQIKKNQREKDDKTKKLINLIKGRISQSLKKSSSFDRIHITTYCNQHECHLILSTLTNTYRDKCKINICPKFPETVVYLFKLSS